MASNYKMAKTISCIDKFFCFKEDEPKYIRNITTIEEWKQYEDVAKKSNENKPVYMEYYTNETHIKPFFDIDVVLDVKSKKKDTRDMNDMVRCACKEVIIAKYPNKDIIVLTRPIRKVIHEKIVKLKISYRLIVDKSISNVDTLKQTVINIKNENPALSTYFDLNVYRGGSNKLCMLGGIKPFNIKKDIKEDLPKPFEFFDDDDSKKYTIFDTAVTCVNDDYERYLDNVIVSEVKKPVNDIEAKSLKVLNNDIDDFKDDDTDTVQERKSAFFIKIVKNHLMALSDDRAIEYNDWFLVNCILCNLYEKYGWSRDTLYELAHSFSEKAGSAYDYKSVDKKISSALASNRNEKVGLPRLIKMLKEDNPEYCKLNIVPTYYEKKEEFEKEICVVNNPLCFYRTPLIPRVITENSSLGDITQQLTESALITMKKNVKYLKKKFSKGEPYWDKEPFIKEWLQDEKRLTFEGLRFEPKGLNTLESKHYKNLFNGFQADRIELTADVDYSRIQPILDHIKIILCDNNEEHYQYVLNWFSRVIQDPTNRPKVGLVFYSDQHGVGKNIFTNYFANEILGFDLSVSAKNINYIFGRFNSLLAKCMFLVIEEASGDLKKFMEELKNIITEPTITVEKKNIDAGNYRNFINLLLNTNNTDILDINDRDRRFSILTVSAIMKGNIEYFKILSECMKNKQNTALFIKYLREEVKCDWNEAQFQDYRPITKAYRKQQALSAKNYIKFISHILTEDGISYNGDTPQDEFRWVKYNGRKSVCDKEKNIYQQYTNMCERYKYTAYNYDKFFDNITSANTGITKIDKHKMKYVKIDKEQCKVWVDLFRNTQNEVVEVYDKNLEEDIGWRSEDEDEDEPAFVGKRKKV